MQTIAQGPFASQEIIKELGNNGGGSYNANSAHPYENPTPLTNMVEMLALLAIPVSLTYTFGRFAGNQRQGWAVFAAAMVILLMGVTVIYANEQKGNPILTKLGANQALTSTQAGGNMEGKEVRFGIADSVPVRQRDHRHLDRRGQHRTRQPDAARRRHRDAQHRPRRGGVRRRRGRHHGAARQRHPGGIHRRPHGGPHARVPGQEDRRPRDEARQPRRALLLRHGAGLRRPGRRRAGRQGRRPEPRSARPLRDPLRYHFRRRATTAAPSPASPRAAASGAPSAASA